MKMEMSDNNSMKRLSNDSLARGGKIDGGRRLNAVIEQAPQRVRSASPARLLKLRTGRAGGPRQVVG